MAQGIQIWDASGRVVMDSTTRVGRVMGQVLTTANTAGSVSVGDFSQGTPFYILLPVSRESFTGSSGSQVQGISRPTVSISGTTLSWTAGTQSYILYGTY